MRYSVWDGGQYRYYEGVESALPVPPPDLHPGLGSAVEESLPTLPMGSRYVGVGEAAVGVLAVDGMDLGWVKVAALWGLAGYGLYKLLKG